MNPLSMSTQKIYIEGDLQPKYYKTKQKKNIQRMHGASKVQNNNTAIVKEALGQTKVIINGKECPRKETFWDCHEINEIAEDAY